ncbi:MAG: hypothetical protein AAF198_14240, partial [Pseudomonadota bacterium]
MLPWVAADTAQIVVVIALLFSLLTFIEYFGRYPSFVEFRFAAPYNRLKFIAVFIVVMMLSLIARGQTSPNTLSSMLSFIGQFMGNTLDFPFSPVRLIVLMMPPDATEQLTNSVRVAAGLSYSVSLITVITFIVFVKMFGWPMRNGAFNVWVN